MKPVWTDEQVVAQLTNWGGRWNNGFPIPFMFYAQSLQHHLYKTGFAAFSEAERQSLLATMQLVSDVANIAFVNIGAAPAAPSTSDPFMGFYTINQGSAPFWGAATRYIVDGGGPPEPMGRIYGVDVVVNHWRANVQGGWEIGDSNSRKLMHELLHGVGLDHAGEYNGDSATSYAVNAAYHQDSNQYTVMSYWAASETGASHTAGGVVQFASTPLLYDVAALQALYGANMATRTGDTVYGFNDNSGRAAFDLQRDPSAVFTIWDAGGLDTLDLSGYATASRIDLREGAFSDAGGLTLNISIAHGARIENAVGGLGNDSITGNALANALRGGGGDDLLSGGAGDDLLDGGTGGDVAAFAGARSLYNLVNFGGGQARVSGPDGTDRLLAVERLQFADLALAVPADILEQRVTRASGEMAAAGSAGGWESQDRYPRASADVNGDGRADIVGFGEDGVFLALANSDGGFGPLVSAAPLFGRAPGAGGWLSQDRHPRLLADVNGDGRADIVGFGDAGAYLTLADGAGGFAPMVLARNGFGAQAGGWESQNAFPRALADVDGDGRADIVGFGETGTYVALARADGTFGDLVKVSDQFGRAPSAGGWASHDLYPRMLADVNGDGRADIVGFGEAGAYLALATGGGGFGALGLAATGFGAGPGAGGWAGQDKFPRLLADLNGDGRADIVGFGNAGAYYALNDGQGGFGEPILGIADYGAQAGGWNAPGRYPRMLADVDGDKRADIVGFGEFGVFVTLSEGFKLAPNAAAFAGEAAAAALAEARDAGLYQAPPPTHDLWAASQAIL